MNPTNARVNWCWTLNNPTESEVVDIRSHTLTGALKYLVYGEEVGDNQTPHLQGYFELTKKARLGSIKKIKGFERAHFEPRFGTQLSAIDYCKKGDQSHQEWSTLGCKGPNFGRNAKITEMGVKASQPGATLAEKDNLIQNRLIAIREDIRNGISEKDIYEKEPLMAAKFPRFISKTINWVTPAIRENLKVELHVGPTNCGKTYHAYARYPGLYATPVKSGTTLWFNGYNGEKVVLFDDFKGEFALTQLLRLLDKYPIRVEVKGDMVWFVPDLVIITSNYNEDTWYVYENREEHREALKRRITSRYLWQKNRTFKEMGEDWRPLMFQPAPIDQPRRVIDEVVILSSSDEEDAALYKDASDDLPANWQDLVDEAYEQMNNVK